MKLLQVVAREVCAVYLKEWLAQNGGRVPEAI